MRQHNVWCVYVRCIWRGMPGSGMQHTPYVMLLHHHTNFAHLKKFKISDFNKEYVSFLKMI